MFDVSGSDDNSQDSLRKVVAVTRVIRHPNYNPQTVENDITLLKLAESVDITVYTPACLPTAGTDYTGQVGFYELSQG